MSLVLTPPGLSSPSQSDGEFTSQENATASRERRRCALAARESVREVVSEVHKPFAELKTRMCDDQTELRSLLYDLNAKVSSMQRMQNEMYTRLQMFVPMVPVPVQSYGACHAVSPVIPEHTGAFGSGCEITNLSPQVDIGTLVEKVSATLCHPLP